MLLHSSSALQPSESELGLPQAATTSGYLHAITFQSKRRNVTNVLVVLMMLACTQKASKSIWYQPFFNRALLIEGH